MLHQIIKALFSSAVNSIASNISQFTVNPEKDLTRSKSSLLINLSLLWF